MSEKMNYIEKIKDQYDAITKLNKCTQDLIDCYHLLQSIAANGVDINEKRIRAIIEDLTPKLSRP